MKASYSYSQIFEYLVIQKLLHNTVHMCIPTPKDTNN